MKKFSVVQVVTDTNVGGAGRWLINFLKGYNQQECDVRVVLPEGSRLIPLVEDVAEKCGLCGVKIEKVKYIGDRSLSFKGIFEFLKVFRRVRPQIVHTHASLSARIAARLCGCKVVYTKHCLGAVNKSKISAFLDNLLCDASVAVSKAVMQNLILGGVDKSKIRLIYNGSEPLREFSETEREAVRKKYGADKSGILVGMAARLEPVKAHETLILAAEIIKKRQDGERIKFLIAGDGRRKDELKKMAESLGESVIFTGFLNDVEEFMNAIDINVMTSKDEALCLSLIEGMSIGKPAVATCIGGVIEVVRNGKDGIVVPVNSPNELADAVLSLAHDSELRRTLGESAREYALEKFSLQSMIGKLQKLYLDILDK